MADALPADVIQAIAISNAKSIGEQPAVLANLALAQQIFNQNMQQQIALSQQQAMNQIQMAAAAKYAAAIDQSANCPHQQTFDQILKDIEKLRQDLSHGRSGA